MEWIKKVHNVINGYKVYLVGIACIIGLAVAWADPAGAVGNWEFIQGVWAIILTMAGRSALKKVENN